ncbi:hypothetical protein GQX74_012238 [Glossina fuscipes]|nr:hypothetical protein GQX74_012238 [Glossina fuscipes]
MTKWKMIKGYMWNYGVFPQNWEKPDHIELAWLVAKRENQFDFNGDADNAAAFTTDVLAEVHKFWQDLVEVSISPQKSNKQISNKNNSNNNNNNNNNNSNSSSNNKQNCTTSNTNVECKH